MKKINAIAAFDFDGTIIRGDSFISFSRYVFGDISLAIATIKNLPYIIGYKLGLYPNWKAKEKLFSCLFKETPIDKFNNLCMDFFNNKGSKLVKKEALECIQAHKRLGHKILIISASPENWVMPFAIACDVDTVIATKINTEDNKVTGVFKSKNCYGIEKVNRLLELFPKRSDYYLYAYGDSRGDKELLSFADKGYYKEFGI